MSMKDILKCKLCGSEEYKNHLVYKDITMLNISKKDSHYNPLLGNIEKTLRIKMNDDGYFISAETCIGMEHMGNIDVPIKYCPFCGRELD